MLYNVKRKKGIIYKSEYMKIVAFDIRTLLRSNWPIASTKKQKQHRLNVNVSSEQYSPTELPVDVRLGSLNRICTKVENVVKTWGTSVRVLFTMTPIRLGLRKLRVPPWRSHISQDSRTRICQQL